MSTKTHGQTMPLKIPTTYMVSLPCTGQYYEITLKFCRILRHTLQGEKESKKEEKEKDKEILN